MDTWMRFMSNDGGIVFGRVEGGYLHEYESLDQRVPAGAVLSSRALTPLAPCAPGKIVALWNNFHALAAKLDKPVPAHPLFLLKPAGSVIGSGEPIRRPPSYAGKIAYEGELGIVIGRRCRNARVAPKKRRPGSDLRLYAHQRRDRRRSAERESALPAVVPGKRFRYVLLYRPLDRVRFRLALSATRHDGRRCGAAELSARRHGVFAGRAGEHDLAGPDARARRCDRVRDVGRASDRSRMVRRCRSRSTGSARSATAVERRRGAAGRWSNPGQPQRRELSEGGKVFGPWAASLHPNTEDHACCKRLTVPRG